MASWLACSSDTLPHALEAALAALSSTDEKLSRNAATCIQRLAACDELAAQLARSEPHFVQMLLQQYQARTALSFVRANDGIGEAAAARGLLQRILHQYPLPTATATAAAAAAAAAHLSV